MRPRKRGLEIFNLSFLDVISCGFGAVVLLVLISNYNEATEPADTAPAHALLADVLAAEGRVAELQSRLGAAQEEAQAKAELLERLNAAATAARSAAAAAAAQSDQLGRRAEGLVLTEESLKRAAIRQSNAKLRDDEVGGIPVDSDYVVFIIDTSGSMKEIWSRVVAEVNNVLAIHPEVKGFQILNDNGAHLVSSYAGKWIPDTPSRRRAAMKLLGGWNGASNSSPVEGVEAALRRYARPGRSLSIYIFGDDYTGASFDPVVKTLTRLNTDRSSGRPLSKVHAVGFLSGHTTDRFPMLMREVARQNGGTFIALPN